MRVTLTGLLALSCAFLAEACTHPAARDGLADATQARAVQACEARPAPALREVAPDPAQLRFARRVACLDAALTGEELLPGNAVTLLVDGPQTHDAQLAAIRSARHHVHLSVYIFTGDEVGQRYLAAFEPLLRRGVQVRVIVDAVGARGMSPEFRERMRRAGVELHVAGPQNPADDPKHWRLSHRDHRKLLIVDGRVAFTGGVNISDQYESDPGASRTSAGWRDTNIRVEGPAVAEFQRLFLDAWQAWGGPARGSPHDYPPLARHGRELVRLVRNDGKDVSGAALATLAGIASGDQNEGNDVYASYLVAIGASRQRIWITQAYFVPNKAFIDALEAAARRGVDVRVLVPGYTDIKTMLRASRWHYQRLLESGIHVYEYAQPEAVLHAKTAVIDGVWATVGSSNLDFRSFIHNDEANAIVLGAGFAGQMEALYRRDLEASREIRLDQWGDRGLRERLLEDWAVLFKYWI